MAHNSPTCAFLAHLHESHRREDGWAVPPHPIPPPGIRVARRADIPVRSNVFCGNRQQIRAMFAFGRGCGQECQRAANHILSPRRGSILFRLATKWNGRRLSHSPRERAGVMGNKTPEFAKPRDTATGFWTSAFGIPSGFGFRAFGF